MAEFLRALGWPEAPSSEDVHRVFQCTNGVAIALYAAKNYEPHYGPRADAFRGFMLGVNLASRDEVLAAYAALQGIDGAELLGEPHDSAHGFSGFSFRDPRRTSGTWRGSAAQRSPRAATSPGTELRRAACLVR